MPDQNQIHLGIDVTVIWSFLRQPGRFMNFTLFDATSSDLDANPRKLCYTTVFSRDIKGDCDVLSKVCVSVDSQGRLLATPGTRTTPASK